MAQYLDKTGVQYIFEIINSSWWNYKIKNNFTAGTGISLAESNGTLTINATHNGTVTKITAGAGLTTGVTNQTEITGSGTLSLTETGVTDGDYGPAENATTTLAHSGTFAVPSYTVDDYGRITKSSTITFTLPGSGNSHYTAKNIVGTSSSAKSDGAVTGTGGVYLNLIENDLVRSSHKIVGGGNVKVTSDASGNITITGTEAQTLSGLGGIGSISFGDDTYISGQYSKSGTTATLTITHRDPVAVDTAALSASATGGSSAWGDSYVKGVALARDAKGHVTGLSVTSGKLPANPNINTWRAVKVNGTQKLGTGTDTSALNFVDGDNITITYDNGVKISAGGFATKTYVDNAVTDAVTGLFEYKGTIGTGGTVTSLPATHNVGDVYYVKTAGTYAGVACEVGDMIICNTAGTTSNNAHWNVVQGNWTATSGSSALSWGKTVTLATIGGVSINAALPSNPNSDTKVAYTDASADINHPILFANNGSSTANPTTGAVYYESNSTDGNGLTYNPSTNILSIPSAGTVKIGEKTLSELYAGAEDTSTAITTINTSINNINTSIGTINTNLSGKAPTSHASSATTYGVGTADKYGHVKVVTGDLSGKTAADGYAASQSHTHGQYLLATEAKAGTVTSITPGTGLTGTNNSDTAITTSGTINLKQATSSELGGVKIAATRTSDITATTGGTTSGRYYGVELDKSGKAFVNVPWTNTTYSSISEAEIVGAFEEATGITVAAS